MFSADAIADEREKHMSCQGLLTVLWTLTDGGVHLVATQIGAADQWLYST